MLKFEAKKAGSEIEFESPVQQTVDLFNNNTILGSIPIPEGTYNEVEFKLQLSPTNTNPALNLKGQITNGTNKINIVFQANEAIEIKGEKNNVTITKAMLHKAITALRVENLSRTSMEE